MHGDPCLWIGETPADGSPCSTALLFQGARFAGQVSMSCDPPVPGLPLEYTDLHFRHVEPTAVFRGPVKLQPSEDAAGFLRRKGCVQRSRPKGVQIVQHNSDDFRLGVGLVHQPLHLVGKVHLRVATGIMLR